MKIYIAGSSAEIERARIAERLLASNRDAGVVIDVISTWPQVIAEVGNANPRDASREQRAAWANADLAQVAHADLFWFLVPAIEAPTRGAWIEFDRALLCCTNIVASGDTKQSIFSRARS